MSRKAKTERVQAKAQARAAVKAAALTPGQRLGRGLANTASGPVDVTRGLVGLGVKSARAGATQLRERYRSGELARDISDRVVDTVADTQETLAREIAVAQEVVSKLPEAIQEARRPHPRRRRGLLIAGVVAVVAAGAAAAAVLRGTLRPEEQPSPHPPAVDVEPRP